MSSEVLSCFFNGIANKIVTYLSMYSVHNFIYMLYISPGSLNDFESCSSLFPQISISGVGILYLLVGYNTPSIHTYCFLRVPDAGFFTFVDIRTKADVHMPN